MKSLDFLYLRSQSSVLWKQAICLLKSCKRGTWFSNRLCVVTSDMTHERGICLRKYICKKQCFVDFRDLRFLVSSVQVWAACSLGQSSWDHLGQVLPRTKYLEDDGVQLKIRENIFSLNYRHTSFYWTLLYCTLQILHFLQIQGVSSKSLGAIFPTAFAHFMSLCHILVILRNSHFFIIIIFIRESVISDLQCYYCNGLGIYFSHQVFLNKVWILFFTFNAITHLIEYSTRPVAQLCPTLLRPHGL